MPTEKAQVSTEHNPKRGEVWLISNNPSISNDPHLPRPVVMMSTNARNKSLDSVLLVHLSNSLSNTHPKFHKLIQPGDGGVSRVCHARCELVSNLEKFNLDSTTGPLGALPDNYIWEIVRGIEKPSYRDDKKRHWPQSIRIDQGLDLPLSSCCKQLRWIKRHKRSVLAATDKSGAQECYAIP